MKKQSGNVLWFILIAIFLLGALTVMLTRTGGQTEETGDSDKAMITATNLMRTATSLEAAFQNLLMRGCSENTISFWWDADNNGLENASDPRYNPNAPTDHSCHIYDSRGAGIIQSDVTGDANVASFVNIGTTSRDIYMVTQSDYQGAPRGISNEVCKAINKLAGVNFDINNLPKANLTSGAFTGVYSSGITIGDNGTELPMAGVKTGCAIDNGCGTVECNSFYSVIYIR